MRARPRVCVFFTLKNEKCDTQKEKQRKTERKTESRLRKLRLDTAGGRVRRVAKDSMHETPPVRRPARKHTIRYSYWHTSTLARSQKKNPPLAANRNAATDNGDTSRYTSQHYSVWAANTEQRRPDYRAWRLLTEVQTS